MQYRALWLLPALRVLLAAQPAEAPREHAADYPAHVELGKAAIGSEYTVHSFSGGRATFVAPDFLVLEVALFPAPGESLMVNAGQFTLRLNHKKEALQAQAPQLVAATLRYPDFQSGPRMVANAGPVIFGQPAPVERFPGDPEARQRTPPRAPTDNPNVPENEPERAEELVVQVALPEGETSRPVHGYLYFAHTGKLKSIRSLELNYTGPAGTATLPVL